MTRKLKFALPPIVLLFGIGVAVVLLIAKPQAASRPRTAAVPMVRVIEVQPRDVDLIVRAHGTVVPEAEIDLTSEVAGRLVYVAPSLHNGGFFSQGDVLLKIDPRDYELSVAAARADVAEADVRLAQTKAEAEVAQREWQKLHGQQQAPPLVVKEPQLAEARATLAAAEARFQRAFLDLERTSIAAPFDGRVREEHVDVGQYVQKGIALARLYSVEAAEVRLPLATRDLAYVDLPLPRTGENTGATSNPAVRLSADFAGKRYTWTGTIVRTEGEIDPKTRMVRAVARVPRPYDSSEPPGRPPLAIGMFVEAEIVGRHVLGVIAVPPIAMRDPRTVMIVDEDNRLRLRRVEVLRAEAEQTLIRRGLRPGERVCVSPLDVVTDGMRVRVASNDEVAESVAGASP